MIPSLYLMSGRDTYPTHLEPGNAIAFKSNIFQHQAVSEAVNGYLAFSNQDEDILLRITFLPGYTVSFDDRKAFNWSEKKSVVLNPVDVERWQRAGVTISVHNYFTHSGERYQILFGLTTVFIFDTNFAGTAEKVTYHSGDKRSPSWQPVLSDPLKVFFYKLDDLPLAERKVIESGRFSVAIPAPSSISISLPPSNFVPNQPRACISWDEGREMRIYHLGAGNILHEYGYSANKDRNSWHHGSLGIILDPSSTIAAIRRRDTVICIHYQDPTSDVIHIVSQHGPNLAWGNVQTTNARAVKGSGIAVAEHSDANGVFHSRIYYQDPELRLRELVHYQGSTRQWLPGDFDPGVQPRGTPITAEGVHGGDVDINVMWRDSHGRAVSSSWSEFSGWDASNGETKPVDGRD